eukprot:15503421-Heterocapsa_arctica.AAC.1
MCERHPNTDRARGPGKLICESGKKNWKQTGKRYHTMNKNMKSRHLDQTNYRCRTVGSSKVGRSFGSEHTHQCDGNKYSRGNRFINERKYSGGQPHHAYKIRDTNNQYGDEDQG